MQTPSMLYFNTEAKAYEFHSDTDTEVAAHLVYEYVKQGADLLEAVRRTLAISPVSIHLQRKGPYLWISLETPARVLR